MTFTRKLGKFIGSTLYAVFYLSPIIGDAISVIDDKSVLSPKGEMNWSRMIVIFIRYAVLVGLLWMYQSRN